MPLGQKVVLTMELFAFGRFVCSYRLLIICGLGTAPGQTRANNDICGGNESRGSKLH